MKNINSETGAEKSGSTAARGEFLAMGKKFAAKKGEPTKLGSDDKGGFPIRISPCQRFGNDQSGYLVSAALKRRSSEGRFQFLLGGKKRSL